MHKMREHKGINQHLNDIVWKPADDWIIVLAIDLATFWGI